MVQIFEAFCEKSLLGAKNTALLIKEKGVNAVDSGYSVMSIFNKKNKKKLSFDSKTYQELFKVL